MTTNSEEVKREAKADPSLAGIEKCALDGTKIQVGQHCVFTVVVVEERGLLYRMLLKADGDCSSQLLLPAKFRQSVFRLDTVQHSVDTWIGPNARLRAGSVLLPGIRQQLTRFPKSCDICQKTPDRGRIKLVPRQWILLPLLSSELMMGQNIF